MTAGPLSPPATAQRLGKRRQSTYVVWFKPEYPGQESVLSGLLRHNRFVVRLVPSCDAGDKLFTDAAPPLALIAGLQDFVRFPPAWRLRLEQQQVARIALLDDDGLAGRLQSVAAGCSHALARPLEAERLVMMLEDIACSRPDTDWQVVLVSGDPDEQDTVARLLGENGIHARLVDDCSHLLQVLDEVMPDLVLVGNTGDIARDQLAAAIRGRNPELADSILTLDAAVSASSDVQRALLDDMQQRLARSHRKLSGRSSLHWMLVEQARMNTAINAHAILSVADAAGDIIDTNEKFTEISGYAAEELRGRNHRVLKSGLHDASFYRKMWKTISSSRVWHGEICNRRKDGSLYWVESTITPVLDADGRPQRYISLRTDITRTKTNQLILQQLAAISNHADEDFPAAAVAWLAGALQVRCAFVSVTNSQQPGLLTPLAVWDRGSLQSSHEHFIAGSPCEIVLQEGGALYVTGVANQFPAARMLGGEGIDSYLGMAFRDRNGGVLGVAGIMDDKPLRDWRDKQEWLSVLVPRLEHILQRARYKRELQRREEQYRTLTQNIPGMVYRVRSDWVVDFLSGAGPICGYDESSFLHTRGYWLKLVHPEDRQSVLDEAQGLESGPRSIVQQYRVMHVDGSLRWVSDHKRSVFDEAGRFLGVDGVLFDITSRKRAELANAMDKERLIRSQRYANIGTWDWNIETSELYWTDRIPVLFGYPEGGLETTYENFLAAVHPEDRHLVTDGVDRCIRQHIPYELEHRVVWPDGSVRWLLERGDVIRDANGKPLHMLGVVQDINDRKCAELALAEREGQLREAQALAHIGNWQADFRSGTLSWSDEIYRIFGQQSTSYVPTVERFHAAVHPDDLRHVIAAEERASVTGVHDVVHRIVRPDGAIRHVHELARADFDADGELVVMIGTVQDVTQQVRSQEALINAREEAERANRAKSEFLSSMSHELRTPMNAILGFSQLLEIDSALDRQQRESIGEIRKAGNHLLHLINEVLDLARIESGQFALSTEPVLLSELVRESLALIQPLAIAREIQVQVAIEGEPVVLADHIRLKQVLLNLLSNAVKYNRPGGLVEIATLESGRGRLRILVRDTGIGIPGESRHRVFEAFTRLHEDQVGIEGTGIGLTITRKLVELMGGSIDFDSSVGQGTCFHVELPLAQGWTRAAAQPVANGSGNRVESLPALRCRTVLLVDDNPANLRLVARILERVPEAELLTAHSGSLGLELVRAHRPDLVLLDINMPDMDGYKLLKLIREDSRLDHIPVLAITANALPSDIEKGKAAGFADYLTKPLDIRHFTTSLRQHLGLVG